MSSKKIVKQKWFSTPSLYYPIWWATLFMWAEIKMKIKGSKVDTFFIMYLENFTFVFRTVIMYWWKYYVLSWHDAFYWLGLLALHCLRRQRHKQSLAIGPVGRHCEEKKEDMPLHIVSECHVGIKEWKRENSQVK